MHDGNTVYSTMQQLQLTEISEQNFLANMPMNIQCWSTERSDVIKTLTKSCRTDILAIKGMQRNMLSDDIEAVIKINSCDCKTGSDALLKPFLYMEIINNEYFCQKPAYGERMNFYAEQKTIIV